MASEGKAPTNVDTRVVQHTKPIGEESTLNSSPQCGNNYQLGQQSRPTNNTLNNTNYQQQDINNANDTEALKKIDLFSNNSIKASKSVSQPDVILADSKNSDDVSPSSVEHTVTSSELLTFDKSNLLKVNNKPTAENNMTQENIPPEIRAQQNAGMRRNARGCKSSEFYQWSEQPFDDMDSPLAVQQYIQQVIRRDPHNVDEILTPPDGQDLGAWKFEHLRQFCMQLNKLASRLQDCCQPQICNQMTATEQWIFLCAAHKTPNECSAIDYTRHTLDSAASLLNNNKYFPSRVTIKESTVAKLGSISRRIYRIFSHAYYHHFQVFDQFERETYLCKRFTKFVTKYSLVSKDNLIVPIDGESSIANTVSQKSPTSSSNEPEQQSKDPLDANDLQTEESLDFTVAENKATSQASETSADLEPPVAASNDTKSNNLLPNPNASSDEITSASNTSTMVKGSMSSALSTSPAGISGAKATCETSSPSSDVAVPAAELAPNNA